MLALQEERVKNNINDYGYVFHTYRTAPNSPINNGTLNEWCKIIGKMIGVETLHPHDWWHSGASALKNAGMALEDVSALLNHASTDVTKKFYIKEDRRRISELKDKFII